MSKIFNQVKLRKPKRSAFDLSHEVKLSCNMGDLVPFYLEHVMPGDKIRCSTEQLCRLAPMLAPMFHHVNFYVHFFKVPYRLVWDNWEKFITGGEDGLQTASMPMIEIAEGSKSLFAKGTLADYLGIPTPPPAPTVVTNPAYVCGLPFRAYQLIYNEYYRDQNLQTKVALTKGDVINGAEVDEITPLRKRCWEKDYYTSALPWTQRGGAVNLPNTPDYKDIAIIGNDAGNHDAGPLGSDANGQLIADYGGSQSFLGVQNLDGINISINDLRRATRLQQWLERNALGGSRYIEQIFAHFGVKSSDARLQRPEYLGGGKTPIVISEVLNMSDTATAPQGNMSGHGISVGKSNSFSTFCEEFGMIIGILSVMPRTAYQQGIHKTWTRTDKFDFPFPEFANLGEQVVKDGEVYHDWVGAAGADASTFGYQSRYSEMKYKPSTVHGDFKDTMSYWHMGRIFSGKPSLNSSFVSCDPTHRVFAVTTPSVHKLYIQLYNNVRAIRPLPYFGTPML